MTLPLISILPVVDCVQLSISNAIPSSAILHELCHPPLYADEEWVLDVTSPSSFYQCVFSRFFQFVSSSQFWLS